MKEFKKKLCVSTMWLAAFALWTAAVSWVDVQAIGPQGSLVGFAGFNLFIHRLTGVHFFLYTVTDWLGLIPIGVCAGFGLLGLTQWIKRRSLRRVDRSILALGGFYFAVMAVYALFEVLVINHRPELIDGVLEASYPSSTTVLTLCVMPTAWMQLKARLHSSRLKRNAALLIFSFTALMVIGRLFSGVHWVTDIIGGMLLSAGLVTAYAALSGIE